MDKDNDNQINETNYEDNTKFTDSINESQSYMKSHQSNLFLIIY